MTRRSLENLIHRRLLRAGWRVQRDEFSPQGWEPARAYWDPLYLRRLGFQPATLIDVGVATGTPELYEAFQDAHLLLVEPVSEFSSDIAKILSRRSGIHVPVALGREPGRREILIEPRRPLLTSFFKRHEAERTGDAPITRQIVVETLDRVVEGHPCPRPFGLKIDAEGSELDVILGATETLRETEFVIAEVSILPRFEGSYSFARFIAELEAQGFQTCDILDIGRAKSSLVTFVDLVFRRCSSSGH